jgi:hypothetical protein
MLVMVSVIWASSAFAQYSVLEDEVSYGPWVGAGGILVFGEDGVGDDQSEFIPAISISGLNKYVAWQAFYGMGEDSTAFGGTLDYVLWSNMEDCIDCDGKGIWWFGAGVTLMDVDDLYVDDTNAGTAVNDTLWGGNLGFGYMWGDWMLSLYGHYLTEDQLAVQAQVNYNFFTK